jgi:hypothetical protein
MAVQTQIQTRRGTAATWTSTNPTLAAGEFGYESDTGKFKIGNGSTAWASLAYTAASTAVTYLFNATSGQTTFSGTDANGLTLAYTVGAEQVYLNGVLQVRGSDYTASNGTSIVLASGALTSDVLNVIAYSAMTVTDTYTQAQADAKFFQNANAFVSGKNKIINGDFGVWQRGTSLTYTSSGLNYLPDRFFSWTIGTLNVTVSQQTFTPGTAPVAGYEGQYFLRNAVTSLSGQSIQAVGQRIEDVRTFAGQTVTFSFWAKADSARTYTTRFIQNFGSGGSGEVQTSGASHSVTTSWQRFSVTVSIPSVSGKTIGTGSYLQPLLDGPANTANTLDTWGWQLEAGSIATPFQTATGTLAGELAACQRYYFRTSGSGLYHSLCNGFITGVRAAKGMLQFPVTMRITPTVFSNGSLYVENSVGTGGNTSTVTYGNASNNTVVLNLTSLISTDYTVNTPCIIYTNNNASSFIAAEAEL